MEVLQRSPLTHPPSMYPPTNMPRVFTSDLYSCYPYETNTPSRTPTPEARAAKLDISSHATTLQSVLRGEIPQAYSHLVTSGHSDLSQDLNSRLLQPRASPCPSHHSPSPRPQSHESYTSTSSDMQTEPMDLTCKKRSRKRSALSAFSHQEPSSLHQSELLSTLPSKLSSIRSSTSSTSPSNLSSQPPSSLDTFPPSPGDGHHGEDREFSLLRNLLSVGKQQLSPPSPSPSLLDRSCDSPASENSFPRTPVTSTTRVTLAKKNLFPVSARVSDFLVKLVRFAKSIPEFAALTHNDKVTLVLNAWSRLMLLYMAESNFHFAVTPTHVTPVTPPSDANDAVTAPSQDVPTMKSVDAVQGLIKKCQQMGVDAKEYEFLRMLVLFNSSYCGLSSPAHVDSLNSVVQQLLQQHVRVNRPGEVMHYSRLLMALPALYGINATMLETLFCKQISKNTDMEVLLKELLQNINTDQ